MYLGMGNASMLYINIDKLIFTSIYHLNRLFTKKSISRLKGACLYAPLSRLKVIRHVFGFGIEFLENKDIGIFGHFMVIDFITQYSSHAYFSPFSTS